MNKKRKCISCGKDAQVDDVLCKSCSDKIDLVVDYFDCTKDHFTVATGSNKARIWGEEKEDESRGREK